MAPTIDTLAELIRQRLQVLEPVPLIGGNRHAIGASGTLPSPDYFPRRYEVRHRVHLAIQLVAREGPHGALLPYTPSTAAQGMRKVDARGPQRGAESDFEETGLAHASCGVVAHAAKEREVPQDGEKGPQRFAADVSFGRELESADAYEAALPPPGSKSEGGGREIVGCDDAWVQRWETVLAEGVGPAGIVESQPTPDKATKQRVG